MKAKRYTNCNSCGKPVVKATDRFCRGCHYSRKMNGAASAPIRERFNKPKGE